MKFYALSSDREDIAIDLIKTSKANDIISCEVKMGESTKTYHYKKLAANIYFSKDMINWSKITKLSNPSHFVHLDEVFKIYRGFKPSGLSSAGAGSLATDMPGKVVKVFVKEGDEVEEGQTLMILEAMKMENEIKAGMSGSIKSIQVEEGQALESGHLMMEIE